MEQQSKNAETTIPRTITVNGLSTDYYNPTLRSYLTKSDFPDELVNRAPVTETVRSIIDHENFDQAYRKLLVDEILLQYERSGLTLDQTSPTYQNISKLLKDNSLTVTTGQQIHIFLGPQFVTTKILSCCALARDWDDKLTDQHVVPVFWMASEDHDFDEIRTARLYNEEYKWDMDSKGPVGRLSPLSLLPLVQQAKERIDQTPENIEFLTYCEKAYSSCSTFADATRYILHHFLGDTGIIILDPDSQALKSRIRDNVKQDLLAHTNSNLIDQAINQMKSHGIKAPINTRPINYFYLSDDYRGRIEQDGDRFSIIGSNLEFSQTELLDQLETNPERFSPNALLRPLYQQTILPNLTYVCGTSELIYWLELKQMFEKNGVIFPYLEVRKPVFFVAQKNIETIEKEGLTPEVLFYTDDHLASHYADIHDSVFSEITNSTELIRNELNNLLAKLEEKGGQPLTKLRKQVEKLDSQIRKETQNRFTSGESLPKELVRILRFKSKIWTSDFIQERNKDSISVVSDLKTAAKLFTNAYRPYLNNTEITVIIT